MSKKFSLIMAWASLAVIIGLAGAMIIVPVWLIQPFAAQTESKLDISFLLKSWSPVLTIIFTFAVIGLAVFIWRNTKRWFSKIPLILPLFLMFVFTWFAHQNHFEWMFNPLKEANFASVKDVNFVADDDMVMAVNINGDAVAFPVLQMAYHHVVQDVVGGMPITATY